MSYVKIDNLYKNQDILMFKECYVLEKIHGTSASIHWNNGKLQYHSGGAKYQRFVELFDETALILAFQSLGRMNVKLYGEAYGGKTQGMRETYGPELKFVVFDINIDDMWLSVPDMDEVAKLLGQEVVHWEKSTTGLDELNKHRDAPSVQSVRNGIKEPKEREGIVIRPLIELTKNNGQRTICKHKGDNFSERTTPQKVISTIQLKVLKEANNIADEWVTEMRLTHILDKLGEIGIESTRKVISAMIKDVIREAEGEIVMSKAAAKAIAIRASFLFHSRLKGKFR